MATLEAAVELPIHRDTANPKYTRWSQKTKPLLNYREKRIKSD